MSRLLIWKKKISYLQWECSHSVIAWSSLFFATIDMFVTFIRNDNRWFGINTQRRKRVTLFVIPTDDKKKKLWKIWTSNICSISFIWNYKNCLLKYHEQWILQSNDGNFVVDSIHHCRHCGWMWYPSHSILPLSATLRQRYRPFPMGDSRQSTSGQPRGVWSRRSWHNDNFMQGDRCTPTHQHFHSSYLGAYH